MSKYKSYGHSTHMLSDDRKGVQFVGEDMHRKHAPTEGNILDQKVLIPYKDFKKRFSETSDTKSFTARDGCTDLGAGLE